MTIKKQLATVFIFSVTVFMLAMFVIMWINLRGLISTPSKKDALKAMIASLETKYSEKFQVTSYQSFGPSGGKRLYCRIEALNTKEYFNAVVPQNDGNMPNDDYTLKKWGAFLEGIITGKDIVLDISYSNHIEDKENDDFEPEKTAITLTILSEDAESVQFKEKIYKVINELRKKKLEDMNVKVIETSNFTSDEAEALQRKTVSQMEDTVHGTSMRICNFMEYKTVEKRSDIKLSCHYKQ
ncbi:hypothetical protein [Cohnella hashimotonis]|uniref:Uncharacterized protein n=1 Tax=Cohnella hashimotonis TaxID=2826895 RepID=A0ABT6TJA4_9BACL|nr:hypothetical protein [Cohnella hashimotonis]MDI4646918.1 hypothetical protein [Cohnella hashimotonis]